MIITYFSLQPCDFHLLLRPKLLVKKNNKYIFEYVFMLVCYNTKR